MDEIWERAVETALDGQTDPAATRILTLDGAVKCLQGRLPPPSILEKFENLQHLSIANIGVSSLEQFPRLRNLQKLILSDNRIAGGLEFLVEAGLNSLRDLDLSNNRIQYIDDLAPLAQLKLVSLDLYECPVTRIKEYRSRVFGLIKSLKYLDKMDAEENERPESDEEDEDDDEEYDPGSGEVDGDDRMNNGHSEGGEGIVDEDEDDQSDADEEETERSRKVNGESYEANGFRIEEVGRDDNEDEEEAEDEDEGEGEEDNDSGEEIDEDDEEEDVVEVNEIGDSDDEEEEDAVEVNEIGDSDDEEDVIEDEDDDDDEDAEEEEVDNDEGDLAELESTGRLASTEGEIDGHEHGEDDGDDDDDIGETGEEVQGVEDDVEFEDEEEDEDGEGYLVQPVDPRAEQIEDDAEEEEEVEDDAEEVEEVEDDEEHKVLPSSSQVKRKRSDDAEEDDDGEDDEEGDDDVIEFAKAPKKHR